MKILLAPSERKTLGGDFPPISKTSFIFEEVYKKREYAIKKYDEFLKKKLMILKTLEKIKLLSF